MRCPFCGHEDSQVKDSRPSEDGASIRRRRQCEGCGGRFTTFERVQLREVMVVKSGGKREAFERAKLERSIDIACRKRPISGEQMDRLVSGIQRQLETSGETEVPAAQIGELVMAGLKGLDPVAYIRFASVYKDFTEARDFEEFAGTVSEVGKGVSFWAYLLRCSDDSYYAGHTDDLETRVAQHQSGEMTGYTHDRRPVTLVWSEIFETRAEALAAEMQIKPWSRAKKEALIAGNWKALSVAAQPPHEREQRASTSLGVIPRLRSGRTEKETTSPHPFVPSEVEGQSAPAERSRGLATAPPPLIVLVRPQLGQNIGKAARAMLNFGLTEMRLVAPRDGWPNPDAGPAASGADIVLEQAQVFETVAEAIADCGHVYATTVRKRGVTKPVVTPVEAAEEIHAATARSAILFGPERSGLETDDVAIARSILTVPINPDFGSLNLAQAVILVAYEWSKHVPSGAEGGQTLAQPPAVDLDPPASQFELDGMIDQFDTALEDAGYFFPPDKMPTTKRMIRTLLTKPGWNAQEVRTLRGMLTILAKPKRR